MNVGAKQRNILNESCGVDLINNPTPKWGSYLYKCNPGGQKI